MLRNEFKEWLIDVKKLKENAANDRVSNAEKVNKVYDLDKEYAKDKCKSLIKLLKYSAEDVRVGNPPKCDIIINGNYYTGLATLRQAVYRYVEFLNSKSATI